MAGAPLRDCFGRRFCNRKRLPFGWSSLLLLLLLHVVVGVVGVAVRALGW